MSYSEKQKLIDNINAIRITVSDSPIGKEEYEKLLKFSGWGGLKGVLLGDGTYNSWELKGASKSELKLHEEYQELFNMIAENFPDYYSEILKSIKNATLTSYYTPSIIPATFFEILKEYTDVKHIYEPSAGSGVFITEALKKFDLKTICAYEKDFLSEKILTAIVKYEMNNSNLVKATIHNTGFEESLDDEDNKYDLITSNIPFGNIPVFDPKFKDNNITGKIHNYFFAKSIDKIRDGGVLAFVTSDSFLNTVSNHTARKYIFDRCDFISLTILPDNLFKDEGTMAPSHFIVVRKREGKTELSPEEELLVESSFIEGSKGKYAQNNWIQEYGKLTACIFTDIKEGKNQYGKPSVEIEWNRHIEDIGEYFKEILEMAFQKRWDSTIDQVILQEKEETKAQTWSDSDIFSKATDIAIEQNGMSDLFKPRSEWTKEELQLSEYVPFKDGLLIEKDE